MNIPFNNLTETTQIIIAKEFSSEIGREDWQTVKQCLNEADVTLCFKVGMNDNLNAIEACNKILDTES